MFAKELKQRKRIRKVIALFLFPVAYIVTFIHAYHGFNLLVKIFLTELSIFDRIVAQRLKKVLPRALSYYYSTVPEFQKELNTSKKPKADYVVLKPYLSKSEKGLISVHWRWQVDIFARNYEIEEILGRYMIILGPDCFGSEWTYPFLALMHKGKEMNSEVFTATKDKNTRKRLSLLGFKTIPYGVSSDYVNPVKFTRQDGVKKEIDIIMIANWNFPITTHLQVIIQGFHGMMIEGITRPLRFARPE